MGGMPLLCQGEHLSPTRQAYVPARYRTRKLLIAKRIHYPLHHCDCVTMDSRGGVIDSVFAKQSSDCGFETRLLHMPVVLVKNVHPDVIKANRPLGIV